MSVQLRCVNPGALATVQDAGRMGYQRYGVPPSGAVDLFTFHIANALVGNDPDEAAVEFTLTGGSWTVEGGACRVAVAGAFPVALNGTTLPAFRALDLMTGDQLKIGVGAGAARGYLAVAGGFDIEPVLGSRATHVRSGLGGLDGKALAKGARLALRAPEVSDPPLALDPRLARHDPGAVRVLPGPQDDCFDAAALHAFFAQVWRMHPQSDRMGLRLDGRALTHKGGFNIVSDGIAPGSIQVPGNGLPIVLLADRQSTGGYPKIATVVSADLPRLGQLRPGDTVRFEAVTVEVAETLAREAASRMNLLRGALRPAGIV